MQFRQAPARQNELAAIGKTMLPVRHPLPGASHRPLAIHLRMRQLFRDPQLQERGILVGVPVLFIQHKPAQRVLRRAMPERRPRDPDAVIPVVRLGHVIQVQHPQPGIGVQVKMQFLDALGRDAGDALDAERQGARAGVDAKHDLPGPITARHGQFSVRLQREFFEGHRFAAGRLQIKARTAIAPL